MTAAAKRRIALVSDASDAQPALADYLTSSGFEVHQCHDLSVPTAFTALVLIGGPHESIDAIVEAVRSWIRMSRTLRIIVVTSKPRALSSLVASHGDRLHVLPAPAFGWDLVDALRANEPTRPRGA